MDTLSGHAGMWGSEQMNISTSRTPAVGTLAMIRGDILKSTFERLLAEEKITDRTT